MKSNWCASCGAGRNFGDQLGPILLRHFGHEVEWATPNRADIVTAGSILSKFPDGWRGTILGTGFIRAGIRRNMRQARVLAVRGAFTQAATRGAAKAILGDPGVLVTDLWKDLHRVGPTYELVVPHYVDKALAARHPEARVAAINGDPLELMTAIANATIVYTSTLHGLIAADAIGVPHVYEPHGDVIGDGFKFRDYGSSLGLRIRAGEERVTPRPLMLAKQEEMRRLFQSLS